MRLECQADGQNSPICEGEGQNQPICERSEFTKITKVAVSGYIHQSRNLICCGPDLGAAISTHSCMPWDHPVVLAACGGGGVRLPVCVCYETRTGAALRTIAPQTGLRASP